MEEIKNDIIKKFSCKWNKENFNIYLKISSGKYSCYDFYLENDKIAIIELMFGLPIEQQSVEQAIKICKNNLNEYISSYYNRYKYDIED